MAESTNQLERRGQDAALLGPVLQDRLGPSRILHETGQGSPRYQSVAEQQPGAKNESRMLT